MSLSEALGLHPVVHVHHFYPIDPATASQQQTAVYNESISPLVAPIIPLSLQQAKEQRERAAKRKHEDVEVDGHASRMTSTTRRTKRAKKVDIKDESKDADLSSVRPTSHRRPYVEISVLKLLDRDQYKPISLSTLGSSSSLGLGRRPEQSPFSSSPTPHTRFSFTPSATSTLSDDTDYSDSTGAPVHTTQNLMNAMTTRSSGTKIKEEDAPVSALDNDDGTSCHQCRRKTLNEKMRCRRLLPGGIVCSNHFCERCIRVRYDDVWDPFHASWHCPRCLGFCNCSICLRKAGLGYILDGPVSTALTGGRGRLSLPRNRSKFSGKAKSKSNASGWLDGDDEVSVRTWLARRGVALGSEEWIEERRRQGVRFVVGMSPPPGPSPYKKALFNAYLAENEEGVEEDLDEVESSLDHASRDEAGIAAPTTTGPEGEASASNPQARDSVLDGQGTIVESGKNVPTPLPVTPRRPSLLRPPTSTSTRPVTSSQSEDILGYGSALARGVRLITGLPLHRYRKKRSAAPKAKIQKTYKLKQESDSDDSDADDQDVAELTITPSAVRVRRGIPIPSLQLADADEKDEDGPITSPTSPSPSPSPEHTTMYPDDPLSTPSPPPAPSGPVLVPTDHFTPSKLDSMHVKNAQAQVGHSYWAFNAFPARVHEDEDAPPSSSLSQAPLYTYTELYSDEDQDMSFSNFNAGSGSPATTMPISNMRDSASTSGTLDHYPLKPHDHDHGYTGHGLSSFEETWIGSSEHEPALGMNMSMDIPPMETEGVSRAVHKALSAAGMQSSHYLDT